MLLRAINLQFFTAIYLFFTLSSVPCYIILIRSAKLWQGAVENLLERSTRIQLLDGSILPLDRNSRKLILDALQEMSTGALRCLGFAYKDELRDFETYDGNEDHPAHSLLLDPSNYSSVESDLIFVGLVGLRVGPDIAKFCMLYFFNHFIFP